MTNGMTYIVRPVMQPAYSSLMRSFISSGSIQLLVGPASFSSHGADEGAVLDPGDVGGVGGARRSELGFFVGVEAGEGAGLDELVGEPGPLLRRSR